MNIASVREGVVLAIDQIRANKFRSALTILGIVIGVATVMAMGSMVTGIRSSILGTIAAAGPKNFMVSRFDFSKVQFSDDGSRPAWLDNRAVTDAETREIAELPTVARAIQDIDMNTTVAVGRTTLESVGVAARGVGWEAFATGDFVAGHNFIEADVRAARPVAVLSKHLAGVLFGSLDPIGRQIRIDGKPFRVIGVFEMEDNIFASIEKNFALIPYSAGIKHLDGDERWTTLLVVTAPGAAQDEAIDQVITVLRTRRGLGPAEANNFEIVRQEQMLETFNKVTGIFFLVMIALSSVALMVGGVGVVAVMMIAVTERTREIGVRKALGATGREILWQFLVESATLTLAGALIGMAIGGSLAFVVNALTPIPATVPLGAVVAACVMAVVAGIFFGLWPAWRASRLDPVVALRYE